jgi:hypothetical protein
MSIIFGSLTGIFLILNNIFHSSCDCGFLIVIAVILGIISIIFIMVAIIATLSEISYQIISFQLIRESLRNEQIKRNKRKKLLEIFKENITHYIDIEKSIFNAMKPDTVDVFLTKYPELKSSDVIIKLVGNTVYNEIISRNKEIRKVWIREEDPWIFKRFIPKRPDDLKDILNKVELTVEKKES